MLGLHSGFISNSTEPTVERKWKNARPVPVPSAPPWPFDPQSPFAPAGASLKISVLMIWAAGGPPARQPSATPATILNATVFTGTISVIVSLHLRGRVAHRRLRSGPLSVETRGSRRDARGRAPRGMRAIRARRCGSPPVFARRSRTGNDRARSRRARRTARRCSSRTGSTADGAPCRWAGASAPAAPRPPRANAPCADRDDSSARTPRNLHRRDRAELMPPHATTGHFALSARSAAAASRSRTLSAFGR
jgi:hypothetical protein